MSLSTARVKVRSRSGPPDGSYKMFVTGDLNIDNVVTGVTLGGITRVAFNPPVVGGSAYNAAIAFDREGFQTIIFGKVGADHGGDLILTALQKHRIKYHVARDEAKPTGTCNIIYFEGHEHPRTIYYWGSNANDYDLASLRMALRKAALVEGDFIFSPLHIYDQTNHNRQMCRDFFDVLRSCRARVIIDVVPHRIYESLNADDLREIIGGPAFMIIGEFRTFMNLIGVDPNDIGSVPGESDCNRIADHFNAEYFLCRYGFGNISHERVFRRMQKAVEFLNRPTHTGYERVPDVKKRGFGDWLTAKTLNWITRKHDLH
jgi:pfkB family carbohydrate kinase